MTILTHWSFKIKEVCKNILIDSCSSTFQVNFNKLEMETAAKDAAKDRALEREITREIVRHDRNPVIESKPKHKVIYINRRGTFNYIVMFASYSIKLDFNRV